MATEDASQVRRFVTRLAIAFVVATLVMGGAVFGVNYAIDDKLATIARVDVKTAPAPPEGANFLVIGSDTRAFTSGSAQDQQAFGTDGEVGDQRSDTIMVVHVEPSARRTLIVSFPRDLWVRIPGHGFSKINAAYNLGPNKLIETLQANFGITIHHYIEVDFKSFRGIIEAVGDVPVHFPWPARDEFTGLEINNPGCVKLNGDDALAYVRSRALQYRGANGRWEYADLTPDIGRINRQQSFIQKLAGLAVAKSLDNPFTANSVVNRVLENLTVDQGLTKQDLFTIVHAFRTVNPNDVSALNFQTLPWKNGDPSKAGGQSILEPAPGWQDLAAALEDFSGDQAAATVQVSDVTVKVLNATGRAGVGDAVATELARLGFKATVGATERTTTTLSEVRYRPDALVRGAYLLDFLDPAARLVADPTMKDVDVTIVLGTEFAEILVPAGFTPPTTAPAGTTPTTVPPATTATPPTTAAPTTTATTLSAQEELARRLGPGVPNAAPCI